MNLFECIVLSIQSLKANKLRAFLTMLGIIIGISSVIIITTLGKSVSKTLEYSFNSLGLNQIYIYAEDIREGDDYTIVNPVDFFTDETINEFLEKNGDRFVCRRSEGLGTGTIENFKNEVVTAEVNGISANSISINNYTLLMGREINQRDVVEARRSCVVSEIFVKQYFRENEYPIGKTIDLVIDNGGIQSFTIVGVVKAKVEEKKLKPGQKYIDLVSTVYIPYKTAVDLKGSAFSTPYFAMFSINPSYSHDESMKILKHDLYAMLRKDYPSATLDISDIAEDFKMVNVVLTVITVVFTLIAAISLLVGGIGVMNIMLVSIVERTREIGVRKAMGAKNSSIRMQFVVEAIMICIIGGAIGIILGIAEGAFIKVVADAIINNFYREAYDYITLTIQPSVIAIVGSVLFCMLIGVFFGFYPANKAAKMNPIDALRYD